VLAVITAPLKLCIIPSRDRSDVAPSVGADVGAIEILPIGDLPEVFGEGNPADERPRLRSFIPKLRSAHGNRRLTSTRRRHNLPRSNVACVSAATHTGLLADYVGERPATRRVVNAQRQG